MSRVCDYKRVLDWRLDLLDSLIQRITTLYKTLSHTKTSVHSDVFTSRCSVAAPNGGRSVSFGFPNYPLPQLPAYNSSSSRLSHSNSD
jgi:hypothetical protein